MHQLIMLRSVANSFICSWNFGNSCGCVSDVYGWHMAQAVPVLERFTLSFFCVSASPWNSRSPIFTCSMKTSWNASSWSDVCFSLWANAGSVSTARKNSTATPAAMRRQGTFSLAMFIRPPRNCVEAASDAIGNTRTEHLVPVIPSAGVDFRLGKDILAPHLALSFVAPGGIHRMDGPAPD